MLINRWSHTIQPFKNEAVLYKLSGTISKIYSKVGKNMQNSTEHQLSGENFMYFLYVSINEYTMYTRAHKKLINIGCLWRRELHAWRMGGWNYFSLFNLLWFKNFVPCACIVCFKHRFKIVTVLLGFPVSLRQIIYTF